MPLIQKFFRSINQINVHRWCPVQNRTPIMTRVITCNTFYSFVQQFFFNPAQDKLQKLFCFHTIFQRAGYLKIESNFTNTIFTFRRKRLI